MEHRRQCKYHDEDFGPCSCSLGKLSRLIEPVMLCLLSDGEPHYGYELVEMIPSVAMTDSDIDVGAVYRALGALQALRAVTSCWQDGHGGPRRHLYRITPTGRRLLRDWVIVLDRLGSAMASFADGCGRLRAPTPT